MAPDERDRIFDKALARHLRADSSSPDSMNPSSRESARASECPGPETLAAYHERSLLPEEMNSWKEHIVGCSNCQAILSHLEATDEIPLQAAVENRVSAQEESVHQVAASGQRQPAVPSILPKQTRRARLFYGARWQWLAPAGALAAGLLVWIALHESSRWLLQIGTKSRSRRSRRLLHPRRQFPEQLKKRRRRQTAAVPNLSPRSMNLQERK